jgi:hypothetical protein
MNGIYLFIHYTSFCSYIMVFVNVNMMFDRLGCFDQIMVNHNITSSNWFNFCRGVPLPRGQRHSRLNEY